MTRHDAKQKVFQLWGEMGVIARATALFALIGSAWLLLTAAYGVAGSLFVHRPAFDRYVTKRDSILAEYLSQRDSEQAVTNAKRDAFEAWVTRELRRECIRHHGPKACID